METKQEKTTYKKEEQNKIKKQKDRERERGAPLKKNLNPYLSHLPRLTPLLRVLLPLRRRFFFVLPPHCLCESTFATKEEGLSRMNFRPVFPAYRCMTRSCVASFWKRFQGVR